MSDNPIASILNYEKLKAFPLRSGTKQGSSLSSLLFGMVLEVLVKLIRQKISKRNKNGKSTTVSVACNMILYIEHPKEATKKLLEVINEFSKVARKKD